MNDRAVMRMLCATVSLATLGLAGSRWAWPADVLGGLSLSWALGMAPLRASLLSRFFLRGFAGLATVALVGVARSPVPDTAAVAAGKLLLWVLIGRLVWVVGSEPGKRRTLALAAVVPGVTCAVWGLGVAACAACGLSEIPGGHVYHDFPLGFEFPRFVGAFQTPNDQALVFVLVLLLLPLVLGNERFRGRLAATALLGLALCTTVSRLVVMGGWAAAENVRCRLPRRAFILVLAGVVVLQIGASLTTHLAVSRSATYSTRWVAQPAPVARVGELYLWEMGYLDLKKAALMIFSAHPLTGVGLRGFGPALAEYFPASVAERLQRAGSTPHSTFGFLAAELGLMGLVGAVAGVLYLGWGLACRQHPSRRCAVLLGILLVIAVDLELHHHPMVYLTTALLTCGQRGARNARGPRYDDTSTATALERRPAGRREA